MAVEEPHRPHELLISSRDLLCSMEFKASELDFVHRWRRNWREDLAGPHHPDSKAFHPFNGGSRAGHVTVVTAGTLMYWLRTTVDFKNF